MQNSLSTLEPCSTDSLGHQHCAKKLRPKITLHIKVLCESKAMLPKTLGLGFLTQIYVAFFHQTIRLLNDIMRPALRGVGREFSPILNDSGLQNVWDGTEEEVSTTLLSIGLLLLLDRHPERVPSSPKNWSTAEWRGDDRGMARFSPRHTLMWHEYRLASRKAVICCWLIRSSGS